MSMTCWRRLRNFARGVVFSAGEEIEETPICYMAFGTDSEGNGFILRQRKEIPSAGPMALLDS